MAEKEENKYLVIKIDDVKKLAERVGCVDPLSEMTIYGLVQSIIRMREEEGRPTDNKYIVCNQDEPYAEKVWQTILEGEERKEKGGGILTGIFTLDQVKRAFWATFHRSGEAFFSYLGTDEENHSSTRCHWSDFLDNLLNPSSDSHVPPDEDGGN